MMPVKVNVSLTIFCTSLIKKRLFRDICCSFSIRPFEGSYQFCHNLQVQINFIRCFPPTFCSGMRGVEPPHQFFKRGAGTWQYLRF